MIDSDARSSGDALLGRVLGGRFRLEEVIGEGGVGVVYRAQHLKHRHSVAVKVLNSFGRVHADVRKRFEREARALSALSHPNIVGVTDFGLADDMLYLTMEYLEGRTLAQTVRDGGALDAARAIEVTRQILTGLAFAHGRGVLHRDLKPANVFLQRMPNGKEQVKLLDFGLAKLLHPQEDGKGEPTLTRDGAVLGTPAYMAPEQASGGKLDVRADLYSVGVMLFEMLGGRAPFAATHYIDVLHGHLFDPVPRLEDVSGDVAASSELEHLLQRAMAKAPGDRFPNADDMLSAVNGLSHPITHRPPKPLFGANDSTKPSMPNDVLGVSFAPDALNYARSTLDATRPVPRYAPKARDGALKWGIAGFALIALGIAVSWRLFGSSDPATNPDARGLQGNVLVADGGLREGTLDQGGSGADLAGPGSARDEAEGAAAALPGGATEADKQARADGEAAASSPAEETQDEVPAQDAPGASADSGNDERGNKASDEADENEKASGRRGTFPTTLAKQLAAVDAGAAASLRGGKGLSKVQARRVNAAKKSSQTKGAALLLSGHDAFLREKYRDAADDYRDALRLDTALKAYPPMLSHWVELAGYPPTYQLASSVLTKVFGAEALPKVEEATDAAKNLKVKNRLRRLRRKLREASR